MAENYQNLQGIKINMLGNFSFEYNGEIVLRDDGKIHKVWCLLGYLVAKHKKVMGAQELQEVLCGDERSNNPAGAVKNLVYRLRTLLASSGLPPENYIVQKGGVYAWNDQLDCYIDCEQFETFYTEAKKCDESEKKAELYIKAIDLYKGKFLTGFEYDEWAVNLTTHYHRLFVESVKGLYEISQTREQYAQMVDICERAIPIDVYDEDIYIVYIKSLTKLNREKEALRAYQTILRRLYDQLGVNPSKELYAVQKEIFSAVRSVSTDLIAIREDLKEQGNIENCFFCDYMVFKGIYRQIARRVGRTGQSIYIMLCTLMDKTGEAPQIELLTEAMGEMKSVISRVLRRGDSFSRYSPSQYVIMLLDTTHANAEAVGKRLEAVYNKSKISKIVLVDCNIQPLEPKEV